MTESIASWLYVKGEIEPFSIWFLEKVKGESNVTFDPLVGYRISAKPKRLGVYTTDGKVRQIAHSKGNNYGFPDSEDFTPKKKDHNELRFAVFGDSFTAGQYLKIN